jgi:hypothetical protein
MTPLTEQPSRPAGWNEKDIDNFMNLMKEVDRILKEQRSKRLNEQNITVVDLI